MKFKCENFGINFLDYYFDFPTEIHHCYPRNIKNKNSFKVLLHAGEPAPLKWPTSEVRKYYKIFDLILTSDKDLLDLPNAKFFIFGDSWVRDHFPDKKFFNISYLHSVGISKNWDG